MDKILKVAELISSDIRSRANANILRSAVDGVNDAIVLDFTGVIFMSRSFTDELYNFTNEYNNVSLSNMNEFVKSMFNAVVQGRNNKRVFETEESEIKEFDDMNSFSSFLSTI